MIYLKKRNRKTNVPVLFCLAAIWATACGPAVKTSENPPQTPYKKVDYVHHDSVALSAYIFEPPESKSQPRKRHPAIILIHGGAWMVGTPRQHWWYAQHFSQAGYVVMAIEYRKMSEAAFPAALYDCKAAIRWLRVHADQYGIMKESIAVMGDSAGGHLACMAALTRPEDGLEGNSNPHVSSAVQCLIALYPMTDLEKIVRPRNIMERLFKRFTLNYRLVKYLVRDMEGSLIERARKASPVQYVHPNPPPSLFIHGSLDKNVSPYQSRNLHLMLLNYAAPSEYIEVPRPHGFDYFDPNLRREIFNRILQFLHQNLEGAPDVQLAKID
ncbi:MAG: alpha/beta hydrolase fold domain-containing protein [Candidatus Sumerlaeia bacterium]